VPEGTALEVEKGPAGVGALRWQGSGPLPVLQDSVARVLMAPQGLEGWDVGGVEWDLPPGVAKVVATRWVRLRLRLRLYVHQNEGCGG
jgi:hypothetical protein